MFEAATRRDGGAPLADRLRPQSLDDFVGQSKLLAPGTPLRRALLEDRVRSMIFWGPPGVGKTTLGRLLALRTRACFVPFSAVLGSVAELRTIVTEARERLSYRGQGTLVFVDEIHRFNKGQQDAFLPHVEAGTLVLVGATTENPSFAVNAALLSRCTAFRLDPLEEADLLAVLRRALLVAEGLGGRQLEADDDVLGAIARASGGDARRALATLEMATDALADGGRLTREILAAAEGSKTLLYDKTGEEHYNVVSAFIKSMRGSDPDAAVYWMMRMLEAGDDPLFVLRRMLIFASEDIGNADSRALLVVTAADQAFRRMGMPEGMYPLAHAALYLACAPKSNAVKNAWQRAKALVDEHGALAVPKKLRNAVTRLMRDEGYGADYRYPHDEDEGFAAGETYLPDALAGRALYEPVERGEETRIKARLVALRRREGDAR